MWFCSIEALTIVALLNTGVAYKKSSAWVQESSTGFLEAIIFSSMLFCIENGCGHTAGCQGQNLAMLLWDKNVILLSDYLRAFGC